jgi:hypothetical protein
MYSQTRTRFFACTDDQIYDVFWRHRNLKKYHTPDRDMTFRIPWLHLTNTTMDHDKLLRCYMYASLPAVYFVAGLPQIWSLAVYRNIFQGKMNVWSQITMCFGRSMVKLETTWIKIIKFLGAYKSSYCLKQVQLDRRRKSDWAW